MHSVISLLLHVHPLSISPFPACYHQVSDFFEGVDILKNIGMKAQDNVRFVGLCCVAYASWLRVVAFVVSGADVCVATGAAIQASYIVSADSDKVQVCLSCVLCLSVLVMCACLSDLCVCVRALARRSFYARACVCPCA